MKENDSTDQYQKGQDGGGITPARSSGASKSGGSASGDDKLRNEANAGSPIPSTSPMARTVSTAGHATSRGTSLEECEAGVPSGRSSIDPGGAKYASKPGSTDQD